MDIVFIIVVILFSLVVFLISLFCLHRDYFSKENLYLIIPLFFFSFWAFHCFYYLNTIKYKEIGEFWDPDFSVFHNAGKQI